MSGKKLLGPQVLKSATLLPTSYGDWVSDPIQCDGLAALAILPVVAGTAPTSISLKVQVSGDKSTWTDVGKVESGTPSLDSLTLPAADAGRAYVVQVYYARWVRFLALRTNGDGTTSLALSVLGGQP